jgi:acyl dehydratase
MRSGYSEPLGGSACYRVQARNTAGASENKIHDDSVARRFGFRGGLVPGVDVYAYLTHPVVARWGRHWLERGAARVRLLKPVYDGEEVTVTSTPDGADAVDVGVRGPGGELCATARATLPPSAPIPPELAAYPRTPLPGDPPPASAETLAPGTRLGSLESTFDAGFAPAYLADVRETLPIYRELGIAHPGWLLRHANYVLALSVRLGPWIHVGSDVQHLGLATDGARISTHARVVAVYEKKGHRFVDLDVLMVVNGSRPLVHVHHTAIYEPRPGAGEAARR